MPQAFSSRAAFTALTFPASAQTQTVYVQLPSGEVVPVTVDVPPGTSIDDIQLPGTPVPAPDRRPTTPTTPTAPTAPNAAPEPEPAPKPNGGNDAQPATAGRRRSARAPDAASTRRRQERRP